MFFLRHAQLRKKLVDVDYSNTYSKTVQWRDPQQNAAIVIDRHSAIHNTDLHQEVRRDILTQRRNLERSSQGHKHVKSNRDKQVSNE